jgi:hypothetical protein
MKQKAKKLFTTETQRTQRKAMGGTGKVFYLSYDLLCDLCGSVVEFKGAKRLWLLLDLLH